MQNDTANEHKVFETFEEAKDALINLAKRKALVKEIELLLK